MNRETLLLIVLQSSFLLGALWAFFKVVPSIPANAKAWMWRLAFLKPLISLLPFATITFAVLPAPKPTSIAPTATAAASPVLGPSPISLSHALPSSADIPQLAEPATDPLLVGWYAGAIAALGYGLLSMRGSRKIVRDAVPVEHPELRETLQNLLVKARVRQKVRLLASREVHSAMLMGGWCSVIVLPQQMIDNGSLPDLRLMLAHEVAHIARRDLMWFGLISVVQSIFFFNPLVWIAGRCSRLDHESATDRHASALAGVSLQTYAEMLLRATIVSRSLPAPGSLPVAESYRTIHRRLDAMKHFHSKPTFVRRTATAALAVLTLSLLPVYQLSAAAWPTGEPLPQTSQKKAVAKSEPVHVRSGKFDIQVKVDKAGKARFYVYTKQDYVPFEKMQQKGDKHFIWTKKGYVEVTPSTRAAVPGQGSGAPAMPPYPSPAEPRGGAGAAPPSIPRSPGMAPNARPIPAAPGSGLPTMPGAPGMPPPAKGMPAPSIPSVPRTDNSLPGTPAAPLKGKGMPGLTVPPPPATGEQSVPRMPSTPLAPLPGEATPPSVLSVQFDNEPAPRALKALFGAAKRNYVLSPEVKGAVNLNLQNVTFDQALAAVLASANAVHRIEGGIFYILPKQAGSPTATDGDLMDIDLNGADINQAIRALFARSDKRYVTSPDVNGVVHCQLKSVTLDTALATILSQVDATFRVENGVYVVKKK